MALTAASVKMSTSASSWGEGCLCVHTSSCGSWQHGGADGHSTCKTSVREQLWGNFSWTNILVNSLLTLIDKINVCQIWGSYQFSTYAYILMWNTSLMLKKLPHYLATHSSFNNSTGIEVEEGSETGPTPAHKCCLQYFSPCLNKYPDSSLFNL